MMDNDDDDDALLKDNHMRAVGTNSRKQQFHRFPTLLGGMG